MPTPPPSQDPSRSPLWYEAPSVRPARRTRTIIEVLIFAAVLLAAIAGYGVYQELHRQAEQRWGVRLGCAGRMRAVGEALLAYAADNQGAYPSYLGELTVSGHLSAFNFVCPANGSPYLYLPPNMVSGATVARPVVWEAQGNHAGFVHVLYSDGRVVWHTNAQADAILRRYRGREAGPSAAASVSNSSGSGTTRPEAP